MSEAISSALFAHPMMPQANHDELARESFLMSMRSYIVEQMDPIDRRLVNEYALLATQTSSGVVPRSSTDIRRVLEAQPYHQAWLTLQRLYQDMMWHSIGESVDRQSESLQSHYEQRQSAGGSLRLDPNFKVPKYIAAFDHHRMSGSYHTEKKAYDFRPGAMYDRYSSTYHYWRNGGWMNDGRGHTIASHVISAYPKLKPRRILDLGCAVGHTTVALKDDFPDAEVYAIDVAAPMLRYAHARAEHLGREIHFSQQNAERTNFPDGYFDLVTSAVTLHETSLVATRRIFEESYRLLAPNGVMVHLEVPARYEQMGLWEQVRTDFESQYNNEPFMAGISRLDFQQLAIEAGFASEDVMAGFRQFTQQATRLNTPLLPSMAADGRIPLGSWYLVSAERKV